MGNSANGTKLILNHIKKQCQCFKSFSYIVMNSSANATTIFISQWKAVQMLQNVFFCHWRYFG
jgi:hypothetical protein